MRNLLVILALILLVIVNYSVASESVANLVNVLFKDYNENLRPVKNETESVVVKMAFGIIHVLRVDWNDRYLTWDPNEHDNVTYFNYPHQFVWKPDMILTNTPDLNNGPVINTAATNVIINSDGVLTLDYTAVYKITCRTMDMANFPFDEHVCTLDFTSWTYNQAQMDIFHHEDYNEELPSMLRLTPNAEWDISLSNKEKWTELMCCPNRTYTGLRFYLKLTRKPLFFLINTILPTMVTCYVCFFGMFCPSTNTGDRTEKTFLGITTLLAISLLMLNVSTLMPVTSTAVPLMGYFLGVYIVTVAIAILCTVFIMQIDVHGLNGEPIPNWAKKWLLQRVGKLLFVRFSKENQSYKKLNKNALKHQTMNYSLSLAGDWSLNKDFIIFFDKVYSKLESLEKILIEKQLQEKYLNEIRNEWSQLSVVVDRICLLLFITWSTCFTISVLCR